MKIGAAGDDVREMMDTLSSITGKSQRSLYNNGIAVGNDARTNATALMQWNGRVKTRINALQNERVRLQNAILYLLDGELPIEDEGEDEN